MGLILLAQGKWASFFFTESVWSAVLYMALESTHFPKVYLEVILHYAVIHWSNQYCNAVLFFFFFYQFIYCFKKDFCVPISGAI